MFTISRMNRWIRRSAPKNKGGTLESLIGRLKGKAAAEEMPVVEEKKEPLAMPEQKNSIQENTSHTPNSAQTTAVTMPSEAKQIAENLQKSAVETVSTAAPKLLQYSRSAVPTTTEKDDIEVYINDTRNRHRRRGAAIPQGNGYLGIGGTLGA